MRHGVCGMVYAAQCMQHDVLHDMMLHGMLHGMLHDMMLHGMAAATRFWTKVRPGFWTKVRRAKVDPLSIDPPILSSHYHNAIAMLP